VPPVHNEAPEHREDGNTKIGVVSPSQFRNQVPGCNDPPRSTQIRASLEKCNGAGNAFCSESFAGHSRRDQPILIVALWSLRPYPTTSSIGKPGHD
jgi:hypothetical protein